MSTSLLAQTYTYLDGSGNKYELIKSELVFYPVKKENSSTGEYSGGVWKKVSITAEEIKLVKAAFEKAIKAKSEQQQDREMMSGLVMKEKKKKKTEVILKSDSEAKKELEEVLKKLISK
jgi:hypothetical protein